MNDTLNSSLVSEECNETTENIKAFTHGLRLYFPPLMIIIGSVCNILVVIVMRTAQFRYLSASFYLCCNAVIDTFSLLILLTAHWLYVNFLRNIYIGEDAHYMCKFCQFVGTTCGDLGIVLTAAMTIERGIVIMFPLKSHSWCTVKRARYVTIILFCCMSVKNITYVFTSDMNLLNDADRLCYVHGDNDDLAYIWNRVWPWLQSTFFVLSFISIITSNIIIIRHIRKSDILRSKRMIRLQDFNTNPGAPHKPVKRYQSRLRQITIMLLIDSFTVIICTTPFSVYTAVNSNMKLLTESEYQRAVKSLVASFSFYLLFINRCANFYLYCLSGTRFRKSLKEILCFCNKDVNFTN